MPLKQINFQNTEVAFASKSNQKLRKAFWLFYSMKFPTLTKVGMKSIKVSLKMRLPISFLIKKTIFEHFCGGESIEDCEKAIIDLGKSNVGTILDYSVEGEKTEEVFDYTTKEVIRTIEKSGGNKDIPFAVFKLTGIASFDLLAKVQAKEKLNPSEEKQFERVKRRITSICERAYNLNTPVFIDAEETWIQDTIDDLAHEMMAAYNKEATIIYNTIQFYRKDGVSQLKKAHLLAKENGYKYGVKMVRGAYMEKERERAQAKNYPSPINDTKVDSDKCYNEGLRYAVEHNNDIALCAGTHNEESSLLLTQLIEEFKLDKGHPSIYFAQLYGMSDHISFNLTSNGYNVAKYVPYGPVKSVMPYLFRRAEENTSISGQTGRELLLIEKEMKRRKS